MAEIQYTLEAKIDEKWEFVGAYGSYDDASKELHSWTLVVGRIRRGNELIDTNQYDHMRYPVNQAQVAVIVGGVDVTAEIELNEWRKKHVG